MQVAGIIAEYNPFHNGHLYQIEQVKRALPNVPLVIAMSGNFLQRGEPACLDKWTRANQALQNGADVVVELPVAACVQPADRFARSGVRSLAALGVTDLFFGAEHAEYDFMTYAKLVKEAHGDFKKYDESYAASFQRAITTKIGHEVSQPNDLLGLAYAKANLAFDSPLTFHPIQRKQAGYHEVTLGKGTIASASAIRKNYTQGENKLAQYIPAQTFNDLRQKELLSWDDFFPYLKYKLLSSSVAELQTIYGMAEGIEYRLKDQMERLTDQVDFETWLKAVKTKRFTYTRLSRLACAILLEMKTAEVLAYEKVPYLRLLGFTPTGQNILNKAKKSNPHPLVTKVSQDDKNNFFALDYRAGKIYQLKNKTEQDLKRAPIRIF